MRLITFLLRRRHRYTLDPFVAVWGPDLPFECRVLPYEHALRARTLPAGTYVFADLDRLGGEMRRQAVELWRSLEGARGVRLLNHPTRSMRRYELLRTLHERGWNDFGVVRLDEVRAPGRWPVFVRGMDDHLGAVSGLLDGPGDLEKTLEALDAKGRGREDHLAVGFHPERGPDGTYVKRAAFVVGDQVVQRHVFFGRDWVVKEEDAVSEALVALEREALASDEHDAHLRRVARLARIEYGRIDYAVVDGRVQVYEINTNPGTVGTLVAEDPREPVHAGFGVRFGEALAAVDGGDGAPVPITITRDRPREAREFALDHLSDVLRALGLRRFEPGIQTRLWSSRLRPRKRD